MLSPWASAHFYIASALRRVGIDAVQVAQKEIAAYHASRKTGRRADLQPAPFTTELAQAVQLDIERGGYDILLALHASTVIPSLKIEVPLVYVTDATALLLNRYYPERRELSERDIEWLQTCEETTITKSSMILVPSQWAADSMLQDYGADPSRVRTIEWGGNLYGVPAPIKGSQRKKDSTIRFLFVGLDWYRKGGDIATEMVAQLRAAGVEADLTVVGAAIPKKSRSRFVHSVGMLNRANPKESGQLDRLFQTADFYIHPARAECFGHALCEALGFGVPVIAADTGGIPQCVIDGETGLLMPPESTALEYAQHVRDLLADWVRCKRTPFWTTNGV